MTDCVAGSGPDGAQKDVIAQLRKDIAARDKDIRNHTATIAAKEQIIEKLRTLLASELTKTPSLPQHTPSAQLSPPPHQTRIRRIFRSLRLRFSRFRP